MFGSIGITEIVLIAGVALVVIGPERFPEFAKIVMKTFREVRGYWDDAKRDISKELRPVQDHVKQISRYKPEEYLDSLMEDDEEDDDESEDEDDDSENAEHDPYDYSQYDQDYQTEEDTEAYDTTDVDDGKEPVVDEEAAREALDEAAPQLADAPSAADDSAVDDVAQEPVSEEPATDDSSSEQSAEDAGDGLPERLDG
ncbi:MAG: twin-arginine translocase subunit TatB [bacterium]|nr:twin-arginine translocase subunit TatB [bacterium]